MRCKDCNVDLGENLKVCPLCGAEASDEENVLEGMRVAEYPAYGKLRPLRYYIKKNDVYFGKYMMWGILLATVLILIVASVFDWMALAAYTVLPALYGVSAVVYFITSVISQKNRVRSAIYLIALAVFNLIIAGIGYIITRESGTVFYALGSGVISLLGLMAIAGKYPEEIDTELSGRFHH